MAGSLRFRTRLAIIVAASVIVVQGLSLQPPAVRAADPSAEPSASIEPEPSTPPDADAPEPAPEAVTAAAIIVPYRATGYRYQVVAHGAGAGFEAVSFDDSAWATGTAAFGSGGGCALQSTVATSWPANTDVLVRRHVSLPSGTTGVTIGIAIDNDVRVYWNGLLVGSNDHENCPTLDNFVYPVADSLLVAGDNVLAVRGIDRGDQSLLDITVQGTLPAGALPTRTRPAPSPRNTTPRARTRSGRSPATSGIRSPT